MDAEGGPGPRSSDYIEGLLAAWVTTSTGPSDGCPDGFAVGIEEPWTEAPVVPADRSVYPLELDSDG